MTWTVEFSPQKEQVGTLFVRWSDKLPEDAWEFSLSIDMAKVKDLSEYAAKIKAIKAQNDVEKAKVPDYQGALDTLAAALNGGK